MRIELANCNYGIAEIPGKGAIFNFQDTDTQILVAIPFASDSIPNFIAAIVKEAGLTETQKRELAPLFNGGIFLPGEGFEKGPQG